MKRIYQNIIDPNLGNSLQAAVASIVEKEIFYVPNFAEYGNAWRGMLHGFFKGHGVSINFVKVSDNRNKTKKLLRRGIPIDGAFLACVPDSCFKDRTHAVLIDRDGYVIHDPNPNQNWLGVNVRETCDLKYFYDNQVVNDGARIKPKGKAR